MKEFDRFERLYLVDFNGTTNKEIGLFATRPNIPVAEYLSESYTIPGRDGDLISYIGGVSDITIPVVFGFFGKPDKWMDKFRAAKRWLLKEDGILTLGDDQQFFYRVKKVTFDEGTREVKDIGEFTVNFLCEGYQYFKQGAYDYDIEEVLFNAYDLCKPVYRITGEGMCTLSVNGNNMVANVGQNLTIDSDLMIAYRTDGAIMNTTVTGDYENLWLNTGANAITITDGFDLKIQPNWRCV